MVTMTLLDPLVTDWVPVSTHQMPGSVLGSPMSIVIAVQSALAIQLPVTVLCAQSLQPVTEPMVLFPLPAISPPAPLVPAPTPLGAAVVSMPDFDPTVTDSKPLFADDTPMAIVISQQAAQSILRFQSVQPVTTPLPACMTPLVMSGPAPLLAAVMTVTESHPHMADCDPTIADVAPVAIVIAVKLPVTVQRLEAVEPMASPMVASPAPRRLSPNPLRFPMVAVTLPDPLVPDGVPLSTNTTPTTIVIAVQHPVSVQGLQTIQPMTTPLILAPFPTVVTPTPLITTMMPVTNPYPTVTNGNPLCFLVTPLTTVVAIQPPVSVQSL